MAPLSDSQLVVLSTACQREEHSVYPLSAKLPGAAAAKVLNSLLAKRLITEVPANPTFPTRRRKPILSMCA